MRLILGSLLFVSIFLMISATALAFPKDENGYKEFYFGEDVNDILSKYEVISVKIMMMVQWFIRLNMKITVWNNTIY